MKRKQLAIALDGNLRRGIEAAAERAGRSLAEEVRRRLLFSFVEDGSMNDPTEVLEQSFKYQQAWLDQ